MAHVPINPPIGSNLRESLEGVILEAGVPVRMRDGATLVANVYTPSSGGPWPVLLMRTAYGRDVATSLAFAHPAWFARAGFIVVIQDVRGRGDSEGSYYPFKYDIEDGYDSIEWAAKRPGSNGCVGMYGFSYQGAMQLFAALGRPPSLKALAPHMTAFDMYSGWFYRNGLLELSTIFRWANQMLREDSRRIDAPSSPLLDETWLYPKKLLDQLPLRKAKPLTLPDLPTYAADWLAHSTADEYWEPMNLLKKVEQLGYPMFHLSGWYDIFLRGSIDGYKALSQRRSDQFLVASPWVHSPWGRTMVGTDLGSEAEPKIDTLVARWFKYWLVPGEPTGPCPLSGCRYFSLGENRWRFAPSWPPPQIARRTLYLSSGGRANSRFGDGRLSETRCEGPEDTLSYEPEVPVFAAGFDEKGLVAFGPQDLTVQQQSNALLVYTSEPLASALAIAGEPRLVVRVQATSPTVDVIARLSRVSADGRVMLLCLGARRVVATNPTEVSLSLDPIAARWSAGERIRLDIAASAFPLFPRNSGTEADALDVASPAEFRRALVVIFHGKESPSVLELPETEGTERAD